MSDDNVITPDFGKVNQTKKRDDQTLDAVSDVIDMLGKCGSCSHVVLYRAEDGSSQELRCHGAPKQLVLVPTAQRKVIMVGAAPQGQSMVLRGFYPPVEPDDMACALYSPNPPAAKMTSLTNKFTFYPETLTDDEKEFVEMFRTRIREKHENPSD